jgi:hypothetical protein
VRKSESWPRMKFMIGYLCEDHEISIYDALKIFYHSTSFEKLCDVHIGLYRESSAYLCELLRGEIMEGKFIQKEI